MAETPDGQEKTEPASGKRLEEARMRGQVSKSVDITTAVIIVFGMVIFMTLGAPMIGGIKGFMRDTFFNLNNINITEQNIVSHYAKLLTFLAGILMPILGLIFIAGLAAEISQVGFKFATKKFTEGAQLKTLANPFMGMKKLFFSGRSFFELGKSMLKLFVLGYVVYTVLENKIDETMSLMDRPFYEFADMMVSVTFEMFLKVGVVFIIIAAIDHYYQRFRFKEDMKMTKQEVKEEFKQTEGDPKVKAHLRSLMRNRIRRLMLKKLEKADVVITNPTHFAVALVYEQNKMSSPRLVAKGVDFLAVQIRQIAEKNNIPIVEEPPLARAIFYGVELEQEIPENLYKAVAQVLAYVYHLKNQEAK